MDLDAARRQAREARRSIGSERAELDRRRYDLLEASGLLDGVERMAAYIAEDGEADPLPWRHAAAGRRVYLPVVPDGDDHITFFPASGPDDLRVGRWGILEPHHREATALIDLDVVLVPLVVFDDRCRRAGRGRGYYDRTLGARPEGRQKPAFIGIAHDVQQVPAVPQHPNDVPLDVVVTPTTIHHRRDR